MSARALFGATVAAYAVLLVVAAVLLPERVPVHFGAGGDVDRWADRADALVLFGVLGLLLAALLGGTAAASERMPLSMVNVPHKKWWRAEPSREARLRELLRTDLFLIASATIAFLAVVLALTVRAARLDRPHLDAWFWVALAAYLAFLLVHLVHSHRVRYRPEPEG